MKQVILLHDWRRTVKQSGPWLGIRLFLIPDAFRISTKQEMGTWSEAGGILRGKELAIGHDTS